MRDRAALQNSPAPRRVLRSVLRALLLGVGLLVLAAAAGPVSRAALTGAAPAARAPWAERSVRIAVTDPRERIVELRMEGPIDPAVRTLTIRDPAEEFYGRGSLPSMKDSARAESLGLWLAFDEGSLEEVAEGESVLHVDVPEGAGRLRIERRLRLRDRRAGLIAQHPFASSLGPEGGVLFGTDLVLEVEGWLDGDLADPALDVRFDLPPDWSAVFASRPDGAVHFRDLRDDFVAVGEGLVDRALEVPGGTPFRVVLPPSLEEGVVDWVAGVAAILRAAEQAFGPLPGGRERLVLLLPLLGTENQRLLGHRGANAPQSLVAYVDPRTSDRAEHPLAVVAHECVHWWNGRAMGFTRGGNMPWFTEGATSYHELVLLCRAGLVDPDFVAQALVDLWQFDSSANARHAVSLEWASARFTVEPDATDCVYWRGALVAFLLDLELRDLGPAEARGIDGLVRQLLLRGRLHGKDGMPPSAILEGVLGLGGEPTLEALLARLAAEETPAIDTALALLGYRKEEDRAPYLGLRFLPGEELRIALVLPNGPFAAVARPGDVLVSIAGVPTPDRPALDRLLDELEPGAEVSVSLRSRGPEGERIVPKSLVVGSRPAWRAIAVETPDAAVLARRAALFSSQ